MAETIEQEQLAEPREASEAPPQEAPENPSKESQEETREEPKKESKKGSILIPFLTVLLVLLGIGEAVFWGYFALSAYSNSLARERYEQQQKALAEEQASKGIKGGSSYSPNMKVENGVVTWEREKWVYGRNSQPANTSSVLRREDGLRLSGLPVIKIPYALAQMDTEEAAGTETNAGAETPAPRPETGGTVPIST